MSDQSRGVARERVPLMVVNPIRRVPERVAGAAPPERALIEALELRARDDALSGVALMRECGLHHSLWSRVRRGRERFGADACAKIVARYPDMRAAAAEYLTGTYGKPALSLLADASRVADPRQGGSTRRACR